MNRRSAYITRFLFVLCLLNTYFPGMAEDRHELEKGRYTLKEIMRKYTRREEMVPMRDGTRLFTVIYEPKDKRGKHPILFHRTPYGSTHSPYGDNIIEIDRAAWASYIEHNYIIVFQDIRGKNFSEGVFEDMKPLSAPSHDGSLQTDEATDAYDSIDWLVKNTRRNNGNVGMIGISFPGLYVTYASLCGHPALKAVSPQAPVTDWYKGDDAHHNWAFFLLDMVGFLPFYQYIMTADVQSGKVSKESLRLPEFIRTDAYTDLLKQGALANFTKAFGDSVKMWNNIVAHPDYDDWWEERLITRHITDSELPAVLVVGGLFDAEDCHGAFATYKAYKEQAPSADVFFVEGPWSHGSWPRNQGTFFNDIYFGPQTTTRWYMDNVEYPFFAYYLEGKGDKPASKARVFDSGALCWREYDEGWPAVGLSGATPYYMRLDGSISTEKPAEESAAASYVSDPASPVPYSSKPVNYRTEEYMLEDQRNMSFRPDVLSFQTPVLTEPLRLSGEVEAELFVDISSTDADFVVKIIDVFPDGFSYADSLYLDPQAPVGRALMSGYQMLVRGEIMRGKYRESFREPKPFVPGEVTKVSFTLPDISHTFLPGHRMMFQIQSSWFPLADRNPQTFCDIYTCPDSAFQPCRVSIHLDPNAPSSIKLPVVDN
ncbi:MAG: CocE/NonD family hydrolase [Bacteroidales bacterium]|nr:CocE/NonD family hydrolase [Bacteroidales bacterium]